MPSLHEWDDKITDVAARFQADPTNAVVQLESMELHASLQRAELPHVAKAMLMLRVLNEIFDVDSAWDPDPAAEAMADQVEAMARDSGGKFTAEEILIEAMKQTTKGEQ